MLSQKIIVYKIPLGGGGSIASSRPKRFVFLNAAFCQVKGNTICLENYNLSPLHMYSELSQVFFISNQRKNPLVYKGLNKSMDIIRILIVREANLDKLWKHCCHSSILGTCKYRAFDNHSLQRIPLILYFQ